VNLDEIMLEDKSEIEIAVIKIIKKIKKVAMKMQDNSLKYFIEEMKNGLI